MIARKPLRLTVYLLIATFCVVLNLFCNEMSVFANENFVKPSQIVGQGTDQGTGKTESSFGSRLGWNRSNLIAADKGTQAAPQAASGLISSEHTIQVVVHGTMCPSCLLNLRKELATLNGVKSVDVRAFALAENKNDWRGSKTVATYQLKFDSSVIKQAQIEARIKQLDFGVSSAKIVK
jgi:hypothetical protein